MSKHKYIGRCVVLVLLAPLVLFCAMATLLCLPPVQHWAVGKVAGYISSATGMDVEVGGVRLSLPLDLSLSDVTVRDHEPCDTLAQISRLQVGVNVWALWYGKVDVEKVKMAETEVHTCNLIDGVTVDARIAGLHIESGGIDLSRQQVDVKRLALEGAHVEVNLWGTNEPTDSADQSAPWKLAVHQARLADIGVAVNLPADTMELAAGWKEARLDGVALDLGALVYGAAHGTIADGYAAYDKGEKTDGAGLDLAHWAVTDLNLEADTLRYSPLAVTALVNRLSLKERAGMMLTDLSVHLLMNEESVSWKDLTVVTPHSQIVSEGDMDQSLLAQGGRGRLSAFVDGRIGVADVALITPRLMKETAWESLGHKTLDIDFTLAGAADEPMLGHLQIGMDSLFDLRLEGRAEEWLHATRRRADVKLQFETGKVNDIVSALWVDEKASSWKMPDDVHGKADLSLRAGRVGMDALAHLPEGGVKVAGHYDLSTEEYALIADADSLFLCQIIGGDSLGILTARAEVKGRGTDIFSKHAVLMADVEVNQLGYRQYRLSDMTLHASLEKHHMRVEAASNNPVLKMQADADALLLRDSLNAHIGMDLHAIDLYALGWVDNPLEAAFTAQIDGESDFKDAFAVQLGLTGMSLSASTGRFTPKDLHLVAKSLTDSVYVGAEAGDLTLRFASADGLSVMVEKAETTIRELKEGWSWQRMSAIETKRLFPEMALDMRAGSDNPVSNFLLSVTGVGVGRMGVRLSTSPDAGIYGDLYAHHIHTDSLELDTLRMDIRQDTAAIRFHTAAINTPGKAKPVFVAKMDGHLADNGGETLFSFFNGNKQKTLELGLRALHEDRGWKVALIPESPVIGQRVFALNKDNGICFTDSGRIEADVTLKDELGTGVRIYSMPSEGTLQDLTVDASRLDVAEILEVLPYAPSITGMLDVELHYVQNVTEEMMLSATAQVEELGYEDYPMGSWRAEAVYLPESGNRHVTSLQMFHEGDVVATLDGSYTDQPRGGEMDASLSLADFPLSPLNAFVPRELLMVGGKLQGELDVMGKAAAPRLDGEIRLDAVKVHSPLYALDFSVGTNVVKVADSRLLFDEFKIFAREENNPFLLSGQVDMRDFSRMKADLNMRAVDYELLNARESKSSVLHGKVFVSLYSTIKGDVANPRIRGNMRVLGKTDVTYVLKESPLTVEDRLGSMVTFVDFADSTANSREETSKELSLGGLDIWIGVEIEQGTEVKVDLGDAGYVEVQGGGNLTMQYSPQGDFALTGRYTLASGEMKYSLPVIPLKTFRIEEGSYVEFMGDPANPNLHVVATERVRASVTEDDTPRYVNFDVGVAVTNTLSSMGLEFTLEAPEDVALQNQLAAMSAEERAKLAVTMLVTGVYAGGQGAGTAGLGMGNALNAFLQSEISNIAGSALKTVDVTIGVEDNYAQDGSAGGHTDYSFRFAKRFWNNRLSVVVGGRISTGRNENADGNNSFIDNISLEWRLDDSGTKYVKLFHLKNYESILEGEIVETGASLVLRKKVDRLSELFVFRRKNEKQVKHEK